MERCYIINKPPFRKANQLTNSSRHNSKYISTFSLLETVIVVGFIAMASALLLLATSIVFDPNTLLIIQPVLASISVFSAFTFVLWNKFRDHLFGEIGFIYLVLILVYTISPAIKFYILEFEIPIGFDRLGFAILEPQIEELSKHFWRHFLFILGIATGYLAFRGNIKYIRINTNKGDPPHYGTAIFIMMFIIAISIVMLTVLLPVASTYMEHYTRFNDLSTPIRSVVYICLIFKNGGYFILLALMFGEYGKYKWLIFLIVSLICTYEVVFSFGSRIVALTILMAVLGFYHFKAHPINIKKGVLLFIVMAAMFSVIGHIRHYGYNLQEAQHNIVHQIKISASEFDAVYCTSFHLYHERYFGALPPRDKLMFINDLIMVFPFVNHTKYNPQYWYARHYFPEVEVPPTTLGILSNSAIWGGEWGLLVRSLVNGAFFALLYRWFLRRPDKWWIFSIYMFCFSYCIMTLKYSVFYILSPLFKVLMPPMLLIVFIININKFLKPVQNIESISDTD